MKLIDRAALLVIICGFISMIVAGFYSFSLEVFEPLFCSGLFLILLYYTILSIKRGLGVMDAYIDAAFVGVIVFFVVLAGTAGRTDFQIIVGILGVCCLGIIDEHAKKHNLNKWRMRLPYLAEFVILLIPLVWLFA